jgi:2-polyprenyl-3-methyl-5-hydroxy-6-metoxy-1,4-benzoquinol methylase
MEKNNKNLEKFILEKGIYSLEENQRIYDKFFKHWKSDHEYIYRRFDINFSEKILDIGCSYGYNLINFSKESVGIEFCKQTSDFAKGLGLNIAAINIEDNLLDINDKFDLIWCSDVIVHLISPYKFLYECRSLLKDSGRIVLQIPLMSFFGMHISDCHFYAFNKKSLMYLFEMAGYKIIKTSGLIRKKTKWFNFLFEPLLQLYGGNIWVLAEKQEKPAINFERVFPPKWFKI